MKNRIVLVTGCSTGIGRALALEFAGRDRHRVVATARSMAAIEGLRGDNVDIAQLDVTDDASIEACVSWVLGKYGRIDILVNNAGYALIGPVIGLSREDVMAQFNTNVAGVIAVSRSVAPSMIQNGRGMIVNISSVSGVLATPFAGAYCGAKAAVNLLSDSLRIELAPFGIKVVTVQPGAIRSRFGDTAWKSFTCDETSAYAPIGRYIEARAQQSQQDPTTAEEFALILVGKLEKRSVAAVIRIGNDSARLPFLARLPRVVTDAMMRKRFGLDRLDRPVSPEPGSRS